MSGGKGRAARRAVAFWHFLVYNLLHFDRFRCMIEAFELFVICNGGQHEIVQIHIHSPVSTAGAGGTAAAADRGAGIKRDHWSGRYPDGILCGRSRCVRREPCGQLQHPDDPDHERTGHRRCGGHQPVHRPSGAKKRQGGGCADFIRAVQFQCAGGGGGHRRAARHPAGHLRLH